MKETAEIYKELEVNGVTLEVSNLGNIRRLFKNGKYHYMKPAKRHVNTKYQSYLYIDIHHKHFYVHRLVAEAFLPNPDNLPQVNHKNLNRQDNTLQNLEWCSASQNMMHAYRTKKIINIETQLDLQ